MKDNHDLMDRNKKNQYSYTLGIDASRANTEEKTGVERYAYHLIQELKNIIPSDVRVVLYSREPLRDNLANLPEHWESRVLRWPWCFWTQVRLSWEMLVHPPDMLFVPAHMLPVILPKYRVVTLHDVAFVPFPEAYSLPSRVYNYFAAWYAVKRAQAILTVSGFSKGEIVRYFHADPSRITVTHLGFVRSRFHQFDEKDIEDALRRYGISRPYFLYVGRLERKKNLRGLLCAFKKFSLLWPKEHVSLVLVGKRGHGYEGEVDGGIPENVHELGYVYQDDIPRLYAGAEAFIFISGYEGFGLPAIEAFASGVPVIASDCTSLPEICGSAALFVDASDPVAAARAMHRLVVDKELRAHCIVQGIYRAEEFSWEKTAKETWVVLSRICKKRK